MLFDSHPPADRRPGDRDDHLLELHSQGQYAPPAPPGQPQPPVGMDYLLPEETEQERQARQLREFAATLRQLTPRVWVTRALIAVNVLFFLVMVVSGADLLSPSTEVLLRWGANYGPRVAEDQWWRLLTSAFIHIGLLHILFNMWALASCGRVLELLLGNVGFFVLYLVSALSGSLASLIWHPLIVSAGASGAIFGVFGGLLGFVLPRRDSIPMGLLKQLRTSGGTVIVYNLIFSLSVPNIDMSAHVGGLVAGFLCGLLLSQPLVPSARRGRMWRNALAAAVGTTALVVIAASLPMEKARAAGMLDRFGDVESAVIDTIKRTQRELVANKISLERFQQVFQLDVLPPWRAEIDRLASDRDRAGKYAALAESLANYMRARQQSWELQFAALGESSPDEAAVITAAQEKADALLKDASQAIEDSGLRAH